MELFTQTGGEFLSRWGHYLSGVTWIGLLYYFNFVQVPSFAEMDAAHRTGAIDKLVPRALWWFRWGAVLTALTGLSILAFQERLTDMDYFKSAPGISISTGILIAVVMFLNVWGVIWRAQKIVIASAQGVIAGREADPAAAAAGRRGLTASRTNTLLSIPMLFFMGATSHFAGVFQTTEGGDRMIYWLAVLAIVAIIEINALTVPAAGEARAWPLDSHKNTIISGFVVAAIFYVLWEVLFNSM